MIKSLAGLPIIRRVIAGRMVSGSKKSAPTIRVIKSTTTTPTGSNMFYTKVNNDIIVGTSAVGEMGAVCGYKTRMTLPTGKKADKIINKALQKNTALIGTPYEEILEHEVAKKGAIRILKTLLRERVLDKFNSGEKLGFSTYI